MGTALDAGSNDEREILPTTGLVPRAVTDIFNRCAEMERQAGGRGNVKFEITNSFVELYNEVGPFRPSGAQSEMTDARTSSFSGPARLAFKSGPIYPCFRATDGLDQGGQGRAHHLVGPKRDQGALEGGRYAKPSTGKHPSTN